MRTPGWPLATLLLVAPALSAQQPQAQTPARPAAAGQPATLAPINPAADPRLDALLQQWQQKMTRIQALEALVQRTEKDTITKIEEVSEGWVRFLPPDRVDL